MDTQAKTKSASIECVASEERTREIYNDNKKRLHEATDRMFMWLMLLQWIFAVAISFFVTPHTWLADTSSLHVHLKAAMILGGILSGLPILMCWSSPGRPLNKYVVAVSQVTWSALLIHITGGRIETHFHIFGSLAFLAFYRDYRVLLIATVLVAFDHLIRGLYWPLSVFGIGAESQWLWLEHAAWVVFEDLFLFLSIRKGNLDMQITSRRQAALERTNQIVELEVKKQTHELQHTNDFFTDVMNSIRANICILDSTGIIVATNTHWNQFALDNGATAPTGVGANYLENCRSATGPCGEEAHKVADGIQSVIDSSADEFRSEYPCHSPSEKRWYEIRVSPLARQVKGTVVVVHLNITNRKLAELEKDDLQQRLVDSSHRAGMAEIATGVLHNVGNVLNSVNVSSTLMREKLSSSSTTSLVRANDLIAEQSTDLSCFFANDPRGQHFPAYLDKLTHAISDERDSLMGEMDCLEESIEHIREIVSVQQSYAKSESVLQEIEVSDIVNDAIRTVDAAIGDNGIELVRDFAELPSILVDKHKLLQIMINFVGNAKHAVIDSNRTDKKITIRTYRRHDDALAVEVTDNGVGIEETNFPRLFTHGFTTKENGHGFGLHSSANAAKAMNAQLYLHSDGHGKGATFGIEIPIGTAPEHESNQTR